MPHYSPSMAALAYLAPPVSGLIAFLAGTEGRVRFHGLQAIVLGTVWPAAIYLGSVVSPSVTRVAFFAGACVWVVMFVSTALGRDLGLPGISGRLRDLVAYRVEPDEG